MTGRKIFLLLLMSVLVVTSVMSGKRRNVGDNKVRLIHADVLHMDRDRMPDVQVLNGKVHFVQGVSRLFCDSAYFYEQSNSFKAFGHVRMYRGDTLSLTSDYAFFDGNEELAIARHNVVLKHKGRTLYTDSLNWDKAYGIGYFFDGGKLVDKKNTLTSDWGQYDSENSKAVFNYNVVLKSKNATVHSDTLYYDTHTSVAEIIGPSDIYQKDGHIYTEHGFYNTNTDKASFFENTVITREDGKKMVGDSIYYDAENGISRAFRNVVYVDEKDKRQLTGHVVFYDDSTGYAFATDNATMIDFSQKDTLYMHADSFKLYTFYKETDSVYRKVYAYHKVRAYRTDVQAVCDSLVYNQKDSCLSMYRDPILWHGNQQLLGEVVNTYLNDSTINRVHVVGQALSVQQLPEDSTRFNQISSKEMIAYFVDGNVREGHAIDNVQTIFYPQDEKDKSFIGMNFCETTLLKAFMNDSTLEHVWMPSAMGTIFPMTQIPAGRDHLASFAWFDYIRPMDKNDIYIWRPKSQDKVLRVTERRAAPRNKLSGQQQKDTDITE
ncbi:MAG: OstA-like protein [Prevotella sp.]|nr:OstA-like protein [Prevotella sp.]